MRWMVPAVIPLSHLRKRRLREVKSVAQGKARTYYLLQSLSDSKAQTLTYVAILPKPTAIPVALGLWHGVEYPQVGSRPKQIDPVFSFHISLLTGSAGSWESGEGLPTLSHLQLRSWDSCTTPLQGHQPPIVGRVMPEFLFSFPGNPIQMSGQGSSDTYFEL